ncbi:hypothetical protein H4R21_006169, partial [Coemansia helicoidea]
CHPARTCLDKVISGIVHAWRKEPVFEPLADDDNAVDTGLPASDAPTAAPVVHVMSPAKHTSITSVLMVLSYAVAMSVTSLDLVLSFVGSTGSTCISFILPGVLYYKMHEHTRWTHMKVLSVLLAVYGMFVLVFCLGANISRVLEGDL